MISSLVMRLSPESVKASSAAGEPIILKLTRAPGNKAPIGGLKVVTASGWFAARPSGTEAVYKIYAERLPRRAASADARERHATDRAGRLIAIAIVGMEERGVLLRRPQKSAGRRARAR